MLYNLHFFFSSKCRLFHNATLFGFRITDILNTGCAKIKKKIRRQKVKLWWENLKRKDRRETSRICALYVRQTSITAMIC